MTDEQIKKSLECCGNEKGNMCSKCPKYSGDNDFCQEELHRLALDLINRLQDKNKAYKYYYDECLKDLKKANTENERLQEAIDEQDIEISRLYKRIDEAKTEAYKEFAERLKENSIATFSFKGVVMVEEIDDLVKEMVGDK